MLDHVPSTLGRFVIPRRVLEETWSLLREPGHQGLEATVLWLGQIPTPEEAQVLSALLPPQVAQRSELGLSVEIPQQVITALVSALPTGVHVLARVHTHPTDAYHSKLDDKNMLIGHTGAISIVVPDFAAGPVDLMECSVNRLTAASGWEQLPAAEVRTLLEVR